MQRGHETLARPVPAPQRVAGASSAQGLIRSSNHFDRFGLRTSAATGRGWCASVWTMSAGVCASAASILAPEMLWAFAIPRGLQRIDGVDRVPGRGERLSGSQEQITMTTSFMNCPCGRHLGVRPVGETADA
jgi:hypothetical protein